MLIQRLNWQLKATHETKHEGVIRFKCHVMNCSFRSAEHKELRRHAKTHDCKGIIKTEPKIKTESKIFKIECDKEGCNSKVINIKKHTKIHGKK